MAVKPGLCRTWSETPKTGFLTTRLIFEAEVIRMTYGTMTYWSSHKWPKTLKLFCLVWQLINVPVNTFSVMLRWSRCVLGIYQYFGELKVSCLRTLHGGRGVRTLDWTSRSGVRRSTTEPPRPRTQRCIYKQLVCKIGTCGNIEFQQFYLFICDPPTPTFWTTKQLFRVTVKTT